MDMIIQGLWGTEIARCFTVIIGVVFAISFLLYIFKGEKRAWISGKVPAILTSIGLFGTFVGIAIGLGEFDSTNIDASVINLLDGMKLAFWTSILGMLGALIINAHHYIAGLLAKGI